MNFLIGFEISYNNLNLPTVIYTEGDMGLYYTYLSDGTKIKVCGYDDNEPTRYAGSLVYNDGTFESASFGGGRIVGTNNGANSEVHYFLTDHLGSTRVVAKVTPAGRIDLDRKDYYPFGKEWKQSGMRRAATRSCSRARSVSTARATTEPSPRSTTSAHGSTTPTAFTFCNKIHYWRNTIL